MENQEVIIHHLPQELMEIKKSFALKTSIDIDDILINFSPSLKSIAELNKEIERVNFESPSDIDTQLSRQIRLKYKKIRTESENMKDHLSEDYKLVHKAITSANSLIASCCKLKENKLDEVEKFAEIQEQKRLTTLKQERTAALLPYGFNVDDAFGMEKMSQEMWDAFLSGAKSKHEARVAAEEKAKADAFEAERIRKENEAKLKAENEKLRKENEEKERQAQEERKKQAAILEEHKAESDAKLKKEQAEKSKLQAELKAKEDSERKIIEEKEAIERKRISDEKMAAKAPDKEKLKKVMESMSRGADLEMDFCELKTEDGKKIQLEIIAKYNGFIKWALTQIETL